ncbi:MAG TPA: TonB-dependent receptor [Thermoanaerobaculia bacterium]|nr:TonB-dependent receptor [Thermoanaerobaculia bacterium]
MSMQHDVRTRSLRRFAAAFALLLLLAVPGMAQVSTASVEAHVSDTDGGALPGVTVTLENVDTGLKRVSVTGEAGDASLAALPPGTYTATFELEGFSPASQEGVVLRVGQTVQVRAELSAAVAESITVSSTVPLVDVYKTDSSTNIVPEQIESLPVPDRDFQRLAFIAPGVERERGGFRFIGGGPVIGAGGNASQSTILVNGVDFTDPALGLSKIRFSQDAIGEFRVINSRYDTEVGGTAGGALSIVTRGGTNRVAGSVFGFYRADDLREASKLEREGVDYKRDQYGFTFGGPIAQDRTHYFVSFEEVNEDNIAFFRPGGTFAGQAKDVEHPFDQTLGFAKLDHNLSDNHTVSANLAYEKYREDNFRVGGVVSIDAGQELQRDNWNLTLEDLNVLGSAGLNELRLQAGTRKYFEPTNSDTVSEWFSSGNTLQTGSNILGDLLGEGDMYELRDTYHHTIQGKGGSHDLKLGASFLYADDRSRITTYQEGLFLYLTDTRAVPLAYAYGEGSADVSLTSKRYSVFVQDEWRPRSDLSIIAGLRYDLDDGGNNPGFTHPLVPKAREKDTNDFQPRLSFSWDPSKNGTDVIRGGIGLFNGRFLLVPAFTELQQNGVNGGRILRTRLNGALFGLNTPPFVLDPKNPRATGILLNPDITLLSPDLETPESTQASLGWTHSFTPRLFLDAEGVWAEGDNEIVIRDVNFGGNSNPVRPNKAYNQVNMYTNDGRSEYKALILRLNGTLRQNDLVTLSVTSADKKNISDDFSPEFPFGYPNDPANIDAEYGRSRASEDYHIVATGIFHLPWEVTVAPIYEYGSGQPWNHRLGYDFNGDGKNSDRPTGVERNSEDGPVFRQLNLRLTKGFTILGDQRLDLIVEGFNVLNNTNYDVNSIDAAEFLSGPTLANKALPFVRNSNFGHYRATLPGREIQLGLRWVF